jgi:hypothetical protein
MREIRYQLAGPIATVTIGRPEKRGAMTYAMLEEFSGFVAQAGADETVRVLIVTGVPCSFCAGIDLADLAGRDPGDRGRTEPGDSEPGDSGSSDTDRVPLLMACPKPVIAAVDGMAVGMGVEFATQADLRVISTRARFRWNFVHRGLVADTGAGTWLLPRQIGIGPALRLLYTGEDLGRWPSASRRKSSSPRNWRPPRMPWPAGSPPPRRSRCRARSGWCWAPRRPTCDPMSAPRGWPWPSASRPRTTPRAWRRSWRSGPPSSPAGKKME